jgi:hypothetical protein
VKAIVAPETAEAAMERPLRAVAATMTGSRGGAL